MSKLTAWKWKQTYALHMYAVSGGEVSVDDGWRSATVVYPIHKDSDPEVVAGITYMIRQEEIVV